MCTGFYAKFKDVFLGENCRSSNSLENVVAATAKILILGFM